MFSFTQAYKRKLLDWFGEKLSSFDEYEGGFIPSKTYNESQQLRSSIEESAGIYQLMIESENKKVVIRLLKEWTIP